jgi:Porin subfamily
MWVFFWNEIVCGSKAGKPAATSGVDIMVGDYLRVVAKGVGPLRRRNPTPGTSGNECAFVWKGAPRARPSLFVAVFGAIIAQAIATDAGLHAQTLTNPNPPTRAPSTTALPENKQPKPCPAYGPGFVQIPGSDVCVKIGGAVQVQGSTH